MKLKNQENLEKNLEAFMIVLKNPILQSMNQNPEKKVEKNMTQVKIEKIRILVIVLIEIEYQKKNLMQMIYNMKYFI